MAASAGKWTPRKTKRNKDNPDKKLPLLAILSTDKTSDIVVIVSEWMVGSINIYEYVKLMNLLKGFGELGRNGESL